MYMIINITFYPEFWHKL